MLKHLIDFVDNLKGRLKLYRASKFIKKLDYYIENVSFEDNTIIFSNNNHIILFSINDGFLGQRLEATVTIKSDELVSLKTLSDISNIAFIHTCSMSGMKHGYEGIRISIGLSIPGKLCFDNIKTSILYLEQCIKSMDTYIFGRYSSFNDSSLDLSMFEETDLFLFDPQALGEKKQFIYETWTNYLEKAAHEDFYSFSESVVDIKACMLFEEANKLLLSEVGDMVLRELIWNRNMSESSNNDYSVN